MSPIPLINGFSEICEAYDGVLCDVWGVLHNGQRPRRGVVEALTRYREEKGGKVVLITNAPRPDTHIAEHLAEMGIPDSVYDDITSSGDVVRQHLIDSAPKKVFHIGRDDNLAHYTDLPVTFTEQDEAELILCTSLYDRRVEEPEHYRPLFEELLKSELPFLCANPDVVAEQGDKLVWCAGALAQLYSQMGGTSIIMGKPYAPIYDLAKRKLNAVAGKQIAPDRILAIGDGMPTDIKGANAQNLDVLFVSLGIHAEELGEEHSADDVMKLLGDSGLTAKAAIPRLVW
ncbi:TIGR01459 family HAD-type hydrolase [Pseudovibrio sp. SPO723]|uniref:TIGR01459 family HAD-type hydrolase n=1 Tax=Nesiotobacter zosterae TaxID=392721 RepID=UPI0029C1EFCE|nr:TIGR01459 family HAD-type hydrolase [Pseudovibrio sp. SPO723]MDX5592976.1 TIGR01459 family HAD-type hydrolase [Pseudovibrio sp. SPO723]